jgi:hypothetical protein
MFWRQSEISKEKFCLNFISMFVFFQGCEKLGNLQNLRKRGRSVFERKNEQLEIIIFQQSRSTFKNKTWLTFAEKVDSPSPQKDKFVSTFRVYICNARKSDYFVTEPRLFESRINNLFGEMLKLFIKKLQTLTFCDSKQGCQMPDF